MLIITQNWLKLNAKNVKFVRNEGNAVSPAFFTMRFHRRFFPRSISFQTSKNINTESVANITISVSAKHNQLPATTALNQTNVLLISKEMLAKVWDLPPFLEFGRPKRPAGVWSSTPSRDCVPVKSGPIRPLLPHLHNPFQYRKFRYILDN